jgi:serine/threonine protein phosphatase PrpC
MKLEISAEERPRHDTSHDRLSVLRDAHRTLIALADGADSHKAAQAAAARTVNELARCFRNGALPSDPEDWVMVLEGIDHAVLADPDAGETSALVMLVQQGVVVGASVGDSLAYVVRPEGEPKLLTTRKPESSRIGSGLARPVGFGPVTLDGKLITRRASRFDAHGLPPVFAAARTATASPSLSRW